jgi:hypothetical protein
MLFILFILSCRDDKVAKTQISRATSIPKKETPKKPEEPIKPEEPKETIAVNSNKDIEDLIKEYLDDDFPNNAASLMDRYTDQQTKDFINPIKNTKDLINLIKEIQDNKILFTKFVSTFKKNKFFSLPFDTLLGYVGDHRVFDIFYEKDKDNFNIKNVIMSFLQKYDNLESIDKKIIAKDLINLIIIIKKAREKNNSPINLEDIDKERNIKDLYLHLDTEDNSELITKELLEKIKKDLEGFGITLD